MKNNCPTHEIELPEIKCDDTKKLIVIGHSESGLASSIQKLIPPNIELTIINKPPAMGKSEDVLRNLLREELILYLKEVALTQRGFNLKEPKKNFVNKFNKNQHRR